MQYKKLLEVLQQMSPEQLEQDAVVLDKEVGEYYPVQSIEFEDETDVLDKGHGVLTIKNQ